MIHLASTDTAQR